MAIERGSLGLGQRVLLLGAWLASSGFVYVLGVYVGKGMRGGSADIAPRVALPVEVAEPAPPPPDVQAPLTFYDVLGAPDGGGAAAPSAPKPVGAAAPSVPSGPASAARSDDPTEQKVEPKPTAVVATPATRPSGAAPSAAATAVTPAGPAGPAAVPSGVAPEPPPPAVASSPPTVVSSPPAPAAPLPVSADGRWTVYANPSRDRLAVEHERAALRAKGYPAEVVTLRRDGDVWYRIRVGRYATQTQAEEASRRLRADGAGHAFVQSE